MDYELKEKLRQSIYSAFDMWAAQNYDLLKTSITTETIDEIANDAYMEDLFLSKRAFIPGFMRYVTKQQTSNTKLKRQRSTVLKACIISIIVPKGVTLSDLESKSQSDKSYTRRHTQRIIREKYAAAFFEIEQRHKDERLSPYSNVFSPYELPKLTYQELVEQFKNQTKQFSSIKDVASWIQRNALIRNVCTEHLKDLLSFKNEAIAIMRELRYDSDLSKGFFSELKGFSDILLVFHAHFQSIMAVEWWRSRRKQTKRKLIDNGFPLKYSNTEAATARSILLELTKSQEHTAYILKEAALSFKEYPLPDATISLFKQCLETETYTDLQKGDMHENIAVIFRETSRPKLMVQEMKKAVEYFRKANNAYRLCVSLKNLGEAEWMLGFKEAGLRYFAEIESLIEPLDQLKRAKVIGNLAFSARRLGEKKMEIEYLMKYLKEIPEEYTEEILKVDRRLSELMG